MKRFKRLVVVGGMFLALVGTNLSASCVVERIDAAPVVGVGR